jgi:Divergent InlB B-repeat domain/Fibronectin type III domain
MSRAPRIVAAAFVGSVAAVLVALLAGGAGGGTAALVELQVAPRGLGQVSAQPPGRDSGGQTVTTPCDDNDGQDDCRWFYERGTTVRLTASGKSGFTTSFSGWSTPDCPGTGSCTLTLDADLTTAVAVFNPLRLGIVLSNGNAGKVTTDPAGAPCQRKLEGQQCFAFPPRTRVRVTVQTNSGHTFRGWNPGCEPRNEQTCTVAVEDEPTWVGARFDNDDAPQLPTTITVQFRLTKAGNGSGRITATKLDCGSSCSAKYDYGQSISLTARPDAGSIFDGWNGVCARNQTTCTFPAGPITAIKATFARDTKAPSAPGSLTATSRTRTSLGVTWTASTDDVGVTGYRVYVDDRAAGDTTATQYTLDGLTCGRTYRISVDASDAVGNRSQRASTSVDTAPCALAARIAGVGVVQAGSARTVVVKLRVNRATTARLRLLSGSRVVARGRYAVRPGSNALRLGVPKRVPGGSYRLAITLVNPDGGTIALPTRGALLPRPR